MSKSTDERVTSAIGREICQRNGAKALLVGSVANLGSQYVITLDAINAATGDTMAQVQGAAEDKEHVLRTLDSTASQLRGKLGESLASIQKYDKPLEEATTSSLEALKAYTLGDLKHSALDDLGALPFYKRAVELDPNFAMAYARLGTVYGNFGQEDLSKEYRKKAFDLKDRASELEKIYITAHYYADSGLLEKGIAEYELYKQTYPRDVTPYVNLALTYFPLGEFDKALENAKDAIHVDPDEGRGYLWAAVAYAGLNRPSEAATILRAGLQHNPELLGLHDELAYLAFTQGDFATMEKEEALERSPSFEHRLISRHGDIAASHGQIRQALDFHSKAGQMAERLELKDVEADTVNDQAWVLALAEYRKRAIEAANAALRISQSFGTRLRAASALALAGDSKRANDIATEVARSRAEDTLVKAVDVPLVQAISALHNGNASEAIEILKAASPYDKANTRVLYVRGLAFLRAREGNKAAQEFRKVLSLRNFAAADPVLSMAQLGLARAYGVMGETTKSRTAYQDFFALWKDADPDIPILKQAKVEYAKLQ